MENNLKAMNIPHRSELMGVTMKIKQVMIAIALATATLSVQATPATSYYVYDESGHVIGEYDQNGNPIQEHIYLGDRPVAVAVTSNNTTTVDYVTTDQLNTPRAVTDSSQAVDWSRTSDPFGNGQPTGSLTYNLRFPGQYYDAETGHSYNYYRDYDPGTGRYIESDLIGLRGGANTYGYTMANPVNAADPLGLLIWSDDAPQVVTGFPAGGIARYPGQDLSPNPSAAAFTVGTWDIESACECDGSGGYTFSGFTVHFHAVIYLRSNYSCCQQTLDTYMLREFQHVSDMNEWTQKAQEIAEDLEDNLLGGSFSSLAACEEDTKAALNAALGASFNNELDFTSGKWDYPGGPHGTPP